MYKPCYAQHVSLIVLALTALLFLPSTCQAISMDVTVGFDGTVKTDAWTPIAVTLVNTEASDIEGALHVAQGERQEWSFPTCAAKVNLPANSNKLYHTYAKFGEYGDTVTVTLTSGSRTVATRQVRINPAPKDDRLLVWLGNRGARPTYLSGEMVPAVAPQAKQPFAHGSPGPTSSQATIHVGSISSTVLPDRPAAYDSVDVLVISELPTASTNPKALDALGMWVASGGTLVVGTGPNYRNYQTPFYRELLPVDITGTATVPQLSCITSLGQFPMSPGGAAVATSVPKRGVHGALVREGAVPILAERRYGAGRVIYLAFDPLASPFRDWDGRTRFWKTIVATSGLEALVPSSPIVVPRTYGNPYYHGQWGQQDLGFAEVVQQDPAVRSPSFNTIAIFLLLYLVVLVPGNYAVLRRKRRLELAWITVPVIVVAFTFGAYAIGYTMKGGRLQLNVASIVETSSNARYGRLVTDASLFSPARRTYCLSVDDPLAIGQATYLREKEAIPAAYVGETSTIEDISMAMWSSRTFESASGVDLGGVLRSDLILSGSRVQGKITNDTGSALVDCVVVYGQERFRIGTLRPGASATVNIGYRPAPPQYDIYGGERDLARRLFVYSSAAAGRTAQPILLARSPEARGGFGLAGERASVTSSTYYAFRLDYSVGNSFSLRPGMISGSVVQSDNARVDEDDQQEAGFTHVRFYTSGQAVLAYRVPVPPGATVTELKLAGAARSDSGNSLDSTQVQYSMYNHKTLFWDTVQLNSGSRPNPMQYIGPGNEVRVKIRAKTKNGLDTIVTIGMSAEGKR